MSFKAIDPTSGRLVREVPATSQAEVDRILRDAERAFRDWRGRPFEERARIVRRVGELLAERSGDLALLVAEEMGKPVTQGRAELLKCERVCAYYADHAEAFLAAEPVETEASRSYVAFEPLGVILSIMPWNFPFWQVVRFGAPALMAGNAVILKHATNVPGCALAAEEILHEAGLPTGLFRAVFLDNESTEALIERAEIRGVTLTGSTRAGKAVAARAGGVLKRSVLELGGSDPYLILDDADLDRAVEACVTSRLNNSGQSCIAAKRFIVVSTRKEQFEARLVDRMAQVHSGDPREEETQLGPLAREDLRDALHRQVTESQARGARLLLGGVVPEGPGWFYPPTVLSEVGPGMPAYEEELFGPVAAIIPVSDESEAIRVANDSVFGLGGAVFTNDLERGERIAREALDVGCAFVNEFVRSDPRLPFGGVKESGYGRELGPYGIREFVNVKTIWVSRPDSDPGSSGPNSTAGAARPGAPAAP